ncbi:MAG: acyl-CoA dehydrogenase [Gammaproteobacteria bacterium]|nr:acyl-CoA dehydrogenase [Gammaproteobacteria bacterium]
MAALTEVQSMIRDQAKTWIREESPVEKFRQMRDSGSDLRYVPETWSGMIEMGWPGIIIPEQYGGSGLGYLTFGLVLEEIGRHLTASPLFASALVGASGILIGGNEEQKQNLLPRIADGSAIITLAVDEGPRHDPYRMEMEAKKSGSGFLLEGTKTFVQEGLAATDFIVAAKTKKGITLFVVPGNEKGISREPINTMDSRGYASLSFSNVQIESTNVLGSLDEGSDLLDRILDCGRAGLSAEMLGTGAQAFDMTLDYLKTREQFGRVIGSFQALGHRAADLFGKMELSRSCMEAALRSLDDQASDIPEKVSLSKAKVGDFLYEMSNQLIQIHGGIGMTDEFDAGFYLKRARVIEACFGNRAFHKDRYARLFGF